MRIATALLCSVIVGVMMLPSVAARADLVKESAGPMEAAHGTSTYYAQGAMRADFEVNFGGGKLIAGTMAFDTHVGRTRLELDTGTMIVFDGNSCWGYRPQMQRSPARRRDFMR
jgi:hypothetical protein